MSHPDIPAHHLPVRQQAGTFGLHELDQNLHSSIAFTLSDLDDPCVSAIAVSVFRSDLCKELLCHIYVVLREVCSADPS